MSEEKAKERKKIVVFEDDMSFRSSYVSALESRGFEVRAFTSPTETSPDELGNMKPDLISLDIFMPGKTGIDAAKEFLEHEGTANIPFVFVSSQQGDKQDEAKSLHPVAFFEKFSHPISEIARKIDELLHSN